MRLIDADTLIENYKKELEKVDFEKLSDNDKLIIATSAKALIDFTKRQPTAYDIDKVVEELFNKAEFYQDENAKLMQVISLNDAIEIVKQGVR